MEHADRAMRSIRYQLHSAKFPVHRDLAGFEFEHSKVEQGLIKDLATMAFTQEAHNVVFIGGTGTGKTHLATALGWPVCIQSRISSCGFTPRSIWSITCSSRRRQQAKPATGLCADAIYIWSSLDELGYLPFSQAGGALLFHLLSKLYEHPAS